MYKASALGVGCWPNRAGVQCRLVASKGASVGTESLVQTSNWAAKTYNIPAAGWEAANGRLTCSPGSGQWLLQENCKHSPHMLQKWWKRRCGNAGR